MTAGFHSVHAHTYYHAKFLLVLPHRNNNPSGRIRCYLIFLKDEIHLTVMAYVKLFRKIIYTIIGIKMNSFLLTLHCHRRAKILNGQIFHVFFQIMKCYPLSITIPCDSFDVCHRMRTTFIRERFHKNDTIHIPCPSLLPRHPAGYISFLPV